jgi:hypothetical protein
MEEKIMKPWEQYASNETPAPEGKPWEAYQAPVAEEPSVSLPSSVSETLVRVPRAVGLTARVGLEAIPEMVGGVASLANTVNKFMPAGLAGMAGQKIRESFAKPTLSDLVVPQQEPDYINQGIEAISGAGRNVADLIGLPAPKMASERIISSGGKMAAGAGGLISAANKAAKVLSPAAQKIANFLAAAPKQQIAGAAGAGVGGQATKEAGGGDMAQLGMSVAGGLTSAGLAGAANKTVNAVTGILQPTELAAKAAKTVDDIQIQQVDDYLAKSGVDISQLSNAAKAKAREFAYNAMKVGEQPNAAVNQGVLSSLPVPMQGTKGQLSQDFLQQDNERVLADTFFGKPLRNRFEEQQTQLGQNLDAMIGKTGGQTASIKETGAQLQGEALKRYNKAKTATKGAYKQAEEVAGGNIGKPSDNLIQWLDYNQGFKDVDGLITKAQKLGIVTKNDKGELIAGDAPLRNFYELRKTISQQSQQNGALAEAKNLVDDTFEAYGGDLYRDAAKLRREQGVTFESGAKSVRDLVGLKKGTTDQAINQEDVFNKVVINGNRDDIRNVKRLLYTGNREERKAGQQQIENLRKQTLSYIKDAALTDVNGKSSLSVAQLEKAYNRIGKENLEEVLGKTAKTQLDDFVKAANLINKQQPRSATNSATASRLVNLANSVFNAIEKVPVVGPPIKTVGGGTVKAVQASKATQDQMKLLAKRKPKGESSPMASLYGLTAIQEGDD